MEVSSSTKTVVIIVFLLYTIALLAVGYFYKKKLDAQKDKYVENFYTGGRAMGALLVAMMVAAGICSAGTFIGSPGKIYSGGRARPDADEPDGPGRDRQEDSHRFPTLQCAVLCGPAL